MHWQVLNMLSLYTKFEMSNFTLSKDRTEAEKLHYPDYAIFEDFMCQLVLAVVSLFHQLQNFSNSDCFEVIKLLLS